MAKEWYVLRVQAGREDRVTENLERRIRAAGLEDTITAVLAPGRKVAEIKGGQKIVSEQKIYPGYLMVQMDMSDETMAVVRDTPGVGDFLGSGWGPASKPVAMSSGEVDKITAEAESGETDEVPRIDFEVDDNVRIKEGPFVNFDGTVDEVLPEKGLVKVIVTIFGRETPVELEYWQIEKV